MQVELEKRILTIQFPETFSIRERVQDLQKCNPDLELSSADSNSLVIRDKASLSEDYGYLGLKLPKFDSEMFAELNELNSEMNFEFDDREEVFIKMGIIAIIGVLTALISASLVQWARSKKNGNVYSDPTEYEIDDPERPGKRFRRIPDISFVSFNSASKEEQKSWKGSIPVPPNLVIEIVSAPKGLKSDLQKMETVWMKNGADVGLVICPYTKTIYIFEKNHAGYSTQDIHSDFSHPLLPGYTDNFGKYLE